MKYSATTKGFYPDSGYKGTVPSDAVSITADTYSKLLLANSQGYTLSATSSGQPCAVNSERTAIDLSTLTASTTS